MLAAELKKFSAEVTARPLIHAPSIPPRAPRSHPPRTRPPVFAFPVSDGVCVPCAQQQPNRPSTQTGSNPEDAAHAMGGLRLGPGGGGSSIAQSLPSHSHMAMHAAPRKPRVHPSPSPSFAGVPLMALRRVEYVWPRSSLRHPATGRCSVHPVCIQGTSSNMDGLQSTGGTCRAPVREHALHMQCTRSAHAENVQCTCSAQTVRMHVTCTCRVHAHAVHT